MVVMLLKWLKAKDLLG